MPNILQDYGEKTNELNNSKTVKYEDQVINKNL